MRLGSLIASLAGCTSTGSVTLPHVGLRSAECVADPANAVRAICTVELAEAAPASVELTDGTQAVSFASQAAAVRHTIPVWGLTAATEWTWTAGTFSGSFVTGALPDHIGHAFSASGPGEPTVAAVLMVVGCGGSQGTIAAVDLDGRVRWYHDLRRDDEPLGIPAVTLGDDGRIAVLAGDHQVALVDLAGAEIFRVDVGYHVHHDVVRKDGRTHALLAAEYLEEDGLRYVQDLVGTLDDAGNLVGTWEEYEHITAPPPPGQADQFWDDQFPGAIDAWHTNGLHVTDDGGFLLTLKRANAVVLGRETGIDWVLVGHDVGGSLAGTVELVPDGGGDPQFGEMHHPVLLPDGRLTLFDNSAPRGLELAFDEADLTATFVADWPVQGPCPIESSFFPLDGGGALLTCASTHVVREFGPDDHLVRALEPVCDSHVPPTTRGTPIDPWAIAVGDIRPTRL